MCGFSYMANALIETRMISHLVMINKTTFYTMMSFMYSHQHTRISRIQVRWSEECRSCERSRSQGCTDVGHQLPAVPEVGGRVAPEVVRLLRVLWVVDGLRQVGSVDLQGAVLIGRVRPLDHLTILLPVPARAEREPSQSQV